VFADAARGLGPAALALALVLAPPVAAAPRGRDGMKAGAASVRLRVPAGTPLAGYGAFARRLTIPDLFDLHPHAFWLQPHEGELDPLAARALVLEAGAVRIAWVAVDLIAVDRAFTRRVAQRLAAIGQPPGVLILSASHTHSGPGAFLHFGLLNAVSTDTENAAVRDALVDSVAEAVQRARAARVPARIGVASVQAPGLTTGRLGQAVDPEIVMVKIVAERGTPLAVLWNYAIHGTMLGPRNQSLSGDVMGAASRRLEGALGAPVLFVNGAVADVSPRYHGSLEREMVAGRLAAAIQQAWDGTAAAAGAPLAVRRIRVDLGRPSLPVRSCLGRWIPRALRLSLSRFLPRETELVAGVLGGAAWVTVPGELQSGLGLTIKQSAAAHGWQGVVAGVSNDYLGYFLTAADSQQLHYVACANFYGPEAGERLTAAATTLLGRLGEPGR
jgi:neutral/alkaline ceramidase-like enzyme